MNARADESALAISSHPLRADNGRDPEMLYQALSPLRPFMQNPEVNEIAINRPGEIWTKTRTWERHLSREVGFDQCVSLGALMASFNGTGISEVSPILSGSLIYGERVQVVMPPACEPGTMSFTIRMPSLHDRTLDELEAQGSFSECVPVVDAVQPFEHELLKLLRDRRMREFLHQAVLKHRTILVVGKTGSGKTTVTKSLIRSIPEHERLVTIEDVHELFLAHHPNKVHLFYRREGEKDAVIFPKQALASCLRMTPDRILLAELRGDEAWEFIKNVNTGHPGSISTMHANGALEAFEQLTALIKDSRTGAHLETAYITKRLFATVDVVLFYHERKLREVYYDPERKRRAMV
ncbi:P-type DNA transfer ATPase VirB11 (plasmid) [Sphaerotilaceae bacterium SBD11-9]